MRTCVLLTVYLPYFLTMCFSLHFWEFITDHFNQSKKVCALMFMLILSILCNVIGKQTYNKKDVWGNYCDEISVLT